MPLCRNPLGRPSKVAQNGVKKISTLLYCFLGAFGAHSGRGGAPSFRPLRGLARKGGGVKVPVAARPRQAAQHCCQAWGMVVLELVGMRWRRLGQVIRVAERVVISAGKWWWWRRNWVYISISITIFTTSTTTFIFITSSFKRRTELVA